MSFIKSTMLALATVTALAGPALAQGEGMNLRDTQVMVVMADGRMMTRAVTDRATLEAMVQKGKQVTAGQLLVMSGGRLYLIEDYRMPNGKMASDFMMSAQ
jgi:hypothetical protein